MDEQRFTPADAEFETRVRASFARQTMMRTLGVEIEVVHPGRIELVFAHDERFTQQHGFAHAGSIATALDSACGYAALSLMPAGTAVLTVEYKVNLLRPARADRYRACGWVVRAGRTLTVCSAEAMAEGDPRPLATMTGTIMTVVGTDLDD